MATTSTSQTAAADAAELLRRGISEQQREIRVDDVPVRGAVPRWLTGTLVRLSPSQFHAGEQQLRHWFDGLSMLHRFGVRDGKVDYANRFLRTRQYRSVTEEGRLGASEFGTDPCRTLFGRVMTMFKPRFTDNANVNVVQLAGEAIAMTETPMPISFDPGDARDARRQLVERARARRPDHRPPSPGPGHGGRRELRDEDRPALLGERLPDGSGDEGDARDRVGPGPVRAVHAQFRDHRALRDPRDVPAGHRPEPHAEARLEGRRRDRGRVPRDPGPRHDVPPVRPRQRRRARPHRGAGVLQRSTT